YSIVAVTAEGDSVTAGLQVCINKTAPPLTVDCTDEGVIDADANGAFSITGRTLAHMNVTARDNDAANAAPAKLAEAVSDQSGFFVLAGNLGASSRMEVLVQVRDAYGNVGMEVVTVAKSDGGDGNGENVPPSDGGIGLPGTKTGLINGIRVNLVANKDGSVSLILTAGDVAKYPMKDDTYVIEIIGCPVVNIILPISALDGAAVLRIKTDAGTVILTKKMLQAYKEKYGDIIEVSLKTGSITVDLLKDGKSVNYDDPSNPLFITIPITISADTTANGYTAVRKETSGNVIMPYSVFKDGEILFRTASTGTYDVIYNAKTFTDLGDHWAASNITFASARGMFGGVGNDLFSPDTSMTRAMFAQVLANIEGADLSAYKSSRFTDVDESAWYVSAVEWAASIGIVSGYGGGLFGPEDAISREQMAVTLANYIKHKGYSLPMGEITAFKDDAAIASWAYEAVKAVQAAGVVIGKPGNIYDPQGTATRAEVATIFARFVGIHVTYGES
ncbi:MAG: S-layer homology domain-containing protein, partial [Oscillospiraceae bacterium]|nr:S-layer homology domain-containing protein [Oscillospiraceae bacterium]